MDNLNGNKEIGVFSNTSFPLCIVDIKKDMEIVYANDAFYAFLEYTPDELRFKFKNSMTRLFDHATMKKVSDFLKERESAKFMTIEHKLRTKSGNEKWVLDEINCMETMEDCVFMALTDITSYKQLEEEKAYQEEKQNFVLNAFNIDVFEFDFKTMRFHLPHSRFLSLMMEDCAVDAETGIVEKNLHPESVDVYRENVRLIREESKDVIFEFQAKNEKGKYCWYRVTTKTLERNGSKVAFGCIENIEKEKEMTFRYVNEAQYFQAVLSKQEAYGQIDVTEDRIIKVGGLWSVYNEIIDKITFTELAAGFIEKVVHPEDRAHYGDLMRCDNFRTSFEGGISYFEGEFRRIVQQNKMVWIKIFIHLFRNPINGHIMGLLYLQDINDQKRRELMAYHQSEVETKKRIQNREHIQTSLTNYLRDVSSKIVSAFVLLQIELSDDKDEDIVSLANLLADLFRKQDFVSRVKNDEFVLFIKDIVSKESFEKRMQELQKRIAEISTTVVYHIGISFAHRGQSYPILYRQATIAKEYAKKLGNNTYVHYQLAGPKNEVDNILHADLDVNDSLPNVSFDDFDRFVGENGEMTYLIEPDTYDLICANQAFYDRIGKTENECLDMKCYEAVHNRKTPCPFCAKANWSSDKFYIYRNYNEILEQEFLVKNRLIDWNGSQVVLAVAVDLSNDKNIIDSMENGTTENGYIISGVQHLQTSPTLQESMISALETIGEFFRADCVRLWRQTNNSLKFDQLYHWTLESVAQARQLSPLDFKVISRWQKSNKFDTVINFDNVEQMMTHSLEMCDYMNRVGINNQRWIPFIHEGKKYLFSIDNITINFVNNSFLDSFSMFIFNELSNRDMMQTMLYHATHDKLTQAYNRDFYEKDVIPMNMEQYTSVAAVVVNINNFKFINDDRGFDYGNHCLVKLVSMMKKAFNDDIVVRLSGDEFIIVILNTPISVVESKISRLKQLVDKIDLFTVAVGYAWDNVERNISELADLATSMMQANKKLFYDTTTSDSDKNRLIVLNGLINAIENKEFEVFLQPKYNNKECCFFGAEALIRYCHEEYGYISPAQFVETLEQDNMIRFVDLFVFEEVCSTLQRWKNENKPMLKVSCNLSRITLMESDIVETINSIFNQFSINKDCIELEITENDTAVGKAVLFQNARKLHDAGYHISLDDFGTKHTNLNILADIEVDVLKIDKSLINSLARNKRKQTILKNVISMCVDLGIQVIAEGVETKEQEKMLRSLNCHLIQGYLYGKPTPIPVFEELVFK